MPPKKLDVKLPTYHPFWDKSFVHWVESIKVLSYHYIFQSTYNHTIRRLSSRKFKDENKIRKCEQGYHSIIQYFHFFITNDLIRPDDGKLLNTLRIP